MRGRGAVLGLVLGAASSLVVEGVAVAADDAAAAPVSLEAPVGIAAVAFGVIGLVAGLVRHRRTSSPRTAANQRVVPAVAVVDGNPAEVRPATTGV